MPTGPGTYPAGDPRNNPVSVKKPSPVVKVLADRETKKK
jgi:hypothetical protein